MRYTKTIDGKQVYSDCKVITLDGCDVSNPSPSMIEQAGWTEYVPERTLADAIREKTAEAEAYAESLKAVSFFGTEVWLAPLERVNYRTTLEAAKALGQAEITFSGVTASIDTALGWLDRVDVWAMQVTLVLASHKQTIANKRLVSTADAYDATTGYPEQLSITE